LSFDRRKIRQFKYTSILFDTQKYRHSNRYRKNYCLSHQYSNLVLLLLCFLCFILLSRLNATYAMQCFFAGKFLRYAKQRADRETYLGYYIIHKTYFEFYLLVSLLLRHFILFTSRKLIMFLFVFQTPMLVNIFNLDVS